MSACDPLVTKAALGVAPALRAVDCLSTQTASAAFGRLFGGQGALVPALTIALTLYIALFALALLTGRSRIGLSALTPRMMTLGVVLTFATSWVAYQSVVWNLATSGPDQIAGILTGAKGSATQIFADRIDIVFDAIREVAQQNETGPEGAAAATSAFTPAGAMWLGALLLLLGTVGVLVTARIALGMLLAVGPVFVVLGLFNGTRGLCAGWLRGVVLTAVTPLFAVTGGSVTLELLLPVVEALRNGEGIDGRAALALLVMGAVHCALMVMSVRVAGTMVAAWNPLGLSSASSGRTRGSASPVVAASASSMPASTVPAAMPHAARTATIHAAAFAPTAGGAASHVRPSGSAIAATARSTVVVDAGAMPGTGISRQRARGIGSRFQPAMRPQPLSARSRDTLR